jgi:poly-gamma-glutamate synthesis protein (capsule biosynthesis protein)
MSTAGTEDLDARRAVRADPALLRDVEWAGVDAVSLANNHAMNYGADGLLGTIEELDRLGIQHAGGGKDIEEARDIAIVEAGGLKVGLLSLYSADGSLRGNTVEYAGKQWPGLFLLRASEVNLGGIKVVAPVAGDLEAMIEAIEKARPMVDILAVSIHMHWGSNTWKEEVAEYHPFVARSAIDAGADLFIIHGPHVPRGIEQYKHGFIAYSVGDLFFNVRPLGIDPDVVIPSHSLDVKYQSIVVRAVVENKRVTRLEVIPIQMYRDGEYEGIPYLAGREEGREILDRIQRLSRETRTELTIQDGYGVVEADPGNSP